MIGETRCSASPRSTGQPYVGAEFVFSARDEMTTSLIDLLTRRTRAHLHDARATLARRSRHRPARRRRVMRWDDDEVARQVERVSGARRREFAAAGLDV